MTNMIDDPYTFIIHYNKMLWNYALNILTQIKLET